MDDLCTACLCSGRNLYYIGETGFYQLYTQIINEIQVFNTSVCVRICWECRALLRRFHQFKTQVKRCYGELITHIQENTSKLLLIKEPSLTIQHVTSIDYPLEKIKVELELTEEVDFGVDTLKTEAPEHCEPETFANSLEEEIIKMESTKQMHRKIGGHSADSMKMAIELVERGMSIRQASKLCRLSYPTVRLYVKKSTQKEGRTIRFTPNYENRRVFTLQEEEDLAKYIEYCSQLFYGITHRDCRRLAFQMAKEKVENIPSIWIDAEMAGCEWLRSFRKRHPQITLKKPDPKTTCNRKYLESFVRNFKSAMKTNVSFANGSRLYNLDEISTSVQHSREKSGQVTGDGSDAMGTLVTICCIVGATGQALPPAIVFPTKTVNPRMLAGAPPGSLALAAASGSINPDIFADVMRHFINQVSASTDNPALLLMDSHENHLSIRALELAKASGVTVLMLHDNTMAKLQPLEGGLYGIFETYYNEAEDSWVLNNPGKPLTAHSIAERVGPAYVRAMTSANIVNAFEKCGIFPFDDRIFKACIPVPTATDGSLVADGIEESQDQAESVALAPDRQESSSSKGNEYAPAAPLSPINVQIEIDLDPLSIDDDDIKPQLTHDESKQNNVFVNLTEGTLPTMSSQRLYQASSSVNLPSIKNLKRCRAADNSATDNLKEDVVAGKRKYVVAGKRKDVVAGKRKDVVARKRNVIPGKSSDVPKKHIDKAIDNNLQKSNHKKKV